LTGGLVEITRKALGWGTYLLPVTLMVVGMWLVLRNFERIPFASPERLLGLGLLFTNILAILHFITSLTRQEGVFDLAANGNGGGYLGAVLFQALHVALGIGGTAVALLAWLLIGLILALDASILDLFRWVPMSGMSSVRNAWQRRAAAQPLPVSLPLQLAQQRKASPRVGKAWGRARPVSTCSTPAPVQSLGNCHISRISWMKEIRSALTMRSTASGHW